MRSFTSLGTFALLALFPSVASRPVPSKRADFVPQLYSEFQISSGTAGDGEAKANAICVDPFAGVDLKTVSAETLAALVTMRGAAEGAESDFNTEISAATGDALAALKNGKTLNKVLKNTCQAEIFRIQLAQGKDVASQLAKKEATVKKNVAADKANAGKATTGIPDSAGAKEREAKGGNIKPAAAPAAGTTEAAAPAATTTTPGAEVTEAPAAISTEAPVAQSTDAPAAEPTEAPAAASSAPAAVESSAESSAPVNVAAAAPSSAAAATPSAPATGTASTTFTLRKYADFQISSGTAGDGKAKSDALFVDPFAGADLASIDEATVDAITVMKQASSAAEQDYNKLLETATGDAAAALKRGKIQNKLLKLKAFVTLLKIQQAQGKDVTEQLDTEAKLIATNEKLDAAAAGLPSTGIPDSALALAAEAA